MEVVARVAVAGYGRFGSLGFEAGRSVSSIEAC
jgi:hypothetical protein